MGKRKERRQNGMKDLNKLCERISTGYVKAVSSDSIATLELKIREQEEKLREFELQEKREQEQREHELQLKRGEIEKRIKALETAERIKVQEIEERIKAREIESGERRKAQEIEERIKAREIEERIKAQEIGEKMKARKIELEVARLAVGKETGAGKMSTFENTGTVENQVDKWEKMLEAIAPKRPNDSKSFPAYFEKIEEIFVSYGIPKEFQGQLVLPLVGDKLWSTGIIIRLKPEQLNDYDVLKRELLQELGIIPRENLRELYEENKNCNETYPQFAARLRSIGMLCQEDCLSSTRDKPEGRGIFRNGNTYRPPRARDNYREEPSRNYGNMSRKCYECGSPDHLFRSCPNRRKYLKTAVGDEKEINLENEILDEWQVSELICSEFIADATNGSLEFDTKAYDVKRPEVKEQLLDKEITGTDILDSEAQVSVVATEHVPKEIFRKQVLALDLKSCKSSENLEESAIYQSEIQERTLTLLTELSSPFSNGDSDYHSTSLVVEPNMLEIEAEVAPTTSDVVPATEQVKSENNESMCDDDKFGKTAEVVTTDASGNGNFDPLTVTLSTAACNGLGQSHVLINSEISISEEKECENGSTCDVKQLSVMDSSKTGASKIEFSEGEKELDVVSEEKKESEILQCSTIFVNVAGKEESFVKTSGAKLIKFKAQRLENISKKREEAKPYDLIVDRCSEDATNILEDEKGPGNEEKRHILAMEETEAGVSGQLLEEEGCQLKSRSRVKERVPITPVARPELPFLVNVDSIGKVTPPSGREHQYVLCLMDQRTCWQEAVPFRSLTTTATCDELLTTFSRMGISQMFADDRGTGFMSRLTQGFVQRMGSVALVLQHKRGITYNYKTRKRQPLPSKRLV